MSKYSKEEISEVYQKETHPLLDEEDRVAEKSTSEYERMVLLDDPEKYEEEDLEYDDYEPDRYEDDIVLEDVVYANEEEELSITDEDLAEHQLKEKIRRCLPLVNNDEVSQISKYFISRYGKDNLPFDRLQQYIYGQIISECQDSDIECSDNEGLNEDLGNYDEEWQKVSQKQNKKYDIDDDVPF